jgi:uncharacterized protein (DUF433 family)
MSISPVIQEHIVIIDGPSGPTPRIRGHRIRVQDIAIAHEKLGWSPDEIVDQYPALTLADVHAALAYYWDHRDEVEQAILSERAYAEELRQSLLRSRHWRIDRGYGLIGTQPWWVVTPGSGS